jgi:hypothetical protein
MANTPINLFPPATVPWGWVEIGGRKYPVHIDFKQHKLLEAFLERVGGKSNYVISDLANLSFADGAFLVGDGSGVVAESRGHSKSLFRTDNRHGRSGVRCRPNGFGWTRQD